MFLKNNHAVFSLILLLALPVYLTAAFSDARQKMERGEVHRAIEILETGMKRDPHNPERLRLLYRAYRRLGNAEKAEKYLQERIRLANEKHPLICELARLYFDSGRDQDALDLVDAVIQDRPHDIEALYLAGRFRQRLGRLFRVEPYYRRVLRRQPEHLPTLLAYTALLLEDVDGGPHYNRAESLLKRIRHAHPKDPRGYITAARYRLGRREYDQALDRLRTADRLQPDQLVVQRLLLDVYLKRGETGKALRMVQALLKRDDNNHVFVYNRAVLLRRREKQMDAYRGFRKAFTMTPSSPVYRAAWETALLSAADSDITSTDNRDAAAYHLRKGARAAKNDLVPQALDRYWYAVRLNKGAMAPRVKLAMLYRDHNRYERYSRLLRVLERYGDRPDHYRILAQYADKLLSRQLRKRHEIDSLKRTPAPLWLRRVNTTGGPYLGLDRILKKYAIDNVSIPFSGRLYTLRADKQDDYRFFLDMDCIYRDRGFDLLVDLKNRQGERLRQYYRRITENTSFFTALTEVYRELLTTLPIKGQILKKLPQGRILVNVGRDDGVTEKSRLTVYKHPRRLYRPFQRAETPEPIGTAQPVRINERLSLFEMDDILAARDVRVDDPAAVTASEEESTAAAAGDASAEDTTPAIRLPAFDPADYPGGLAGLYRRYGWVLIFPLAAAAVILMRRVNRHANRQ